MRALVLAAILVAGPAVAGDLVLRVPDLSIRLMPDVCTDEMVLAPLREDMRPRFRRAAGDLNGEQLRACWLERAGRILLTFEDGTGLSIPKGEFAEEEGV
jgi:hypothetical protein